jgi:hypothetical protein
MFTKHALWGRIRRLEQITAGLNAELVRLQLVPSRSAYESPAERPGWVFSAKIGVITTSDTMLKSAKTIGAPSVFAR